METRQYHIDDKLVINSEKDNMCVVLFYGIAVVGISIVWISSFGEVNLILTFFLCWMALCEWIGKNRTFIMEKSGCTICFYHYKKFYTWEELAIKRWEDYTRYSYLKPFLINRHEMYYEGIFFSRYPIRKPKWMLPVELFTIRRPMSCFCVNFYPYGITEEHGNYCHPSTKELGLSAKKRREPEVYPVEKKVFINYMKLWNVDIEDLSLDIENIRYISR